MSEMASQITNLTIVDSTVYSGADQRKHQSSASLAFVRGIRRWRVNSPHKWPVTRKLFPFDDVIINRGATNLSNPVVKREIYEWKSLSYEIVTFDSPSLNTLRPRQNGRHFADDIFNFIFLNENIWIPIKISLKFVPNDPINNIPALVQIMAWRRPGDKPLSEPMMVNLQTHICVTRPQWVDNRSVPGKKKRLSCWVSSQYRERLSRHRDFHYKDKVVGPSYIYNGKFYTGKTASLYWGDHLVMPWRRNTFRIIRSRVFFLHRGPIMRSFDTFVVVSPNKLSNKHSNVR